MIYCRRQIGEIQKFFHREVGKKNLHAFFTSRLQNHVFFFPAFLVKEISGLKSPRFSGGPFLATFSFYDLDAHHIMSTYVFQILIEIAGAHVLWLDLDMLVSRRKKIFIFNQTNKLFAGLGYTHNPISMN